MTQQSRSFWISITSSKSKKVRERATSELKSAFTIIKDELNMPLRNTVSIIQAAYQKSKMKDFQLFYLFVHLFCLISYTNSNL